MNVYQRIYDTVAKIPVGKVLTYGMVAKLAGTKSPRLVGKILHANPDPDNVPCHRVVNRQGQVAQKYVFGGAKVQLRKLRDEGIESKNGRVNLSKYLWNRK